MEQLSFTNKSRQKPALVRFSLGREWRKQMLTRSFSLKKAKTSQNARARGCFYAWNSFLRKINCNIIANAVRFVAYREKTSTRATLFEFTQKQAKAQVYG